MSRIKCNVCRDIINSNTFYSYISCKCGKIAVDGGKDYTRIIGEREYYEILDDKE